MPPSLTAKQYDEVVGRLEAGNCAPEGDAAFGELPAPAGKKKSYDGWSKDFGSWLLQSQTIDLLRSPSLKVVSKPGEAERDFRVRLQESTRQDRDRASDALRHSPFVAALP